MPVGRKKKPGVGAKCSILTRFLHPKERFADFRNERGHRTAVTLISVRAMKVNRKNQQCFVCSVQGMDQDCFAVKSHFKIEEEGDENDFFEPLTEEEREKERQAIFSQQFKEPKKKWKKSRARKILFEMLLEGTIPDSKEDVSMSLEHIYSLHPDFALYDFALFRDRLAKLRDTLQNMNQRARDDLAAFNTYKSNHKPSLTSHKGYIQWQGSTSRELLLDDLADGKDQLMSPQELWQSRPEYYDEFPLHAFRSKLEQERRTAKYLHTLQERGLMHRAS